MPEKSSDYRVYLEEKFSHLITLINANHEESMDSFTRLEKKADVTNGRVTKLEDEKQTYLKTRVDKDMLSVIEKKLDNVQSVVNQNLPHTVIHCPQKDVIEDLKTWKKEREAIEIDVVKQESVKTRNWTKIMGMIGLIISFLGMLIAFINVTNKLRSEFNREIRDLKNTVIEENAKQIIKGSYYDPFMKDTINIK